MTTEITTIYPPLLPTTTEFIRYYQQIKNIEIYLSFNRTTHEYFAGFRKNQEIYHPQEFSFCAETWKELCQNIECEARTDVFTLFIGILLKKRFIAQIKAEGTHLFEGLD